jgi:haloalkane dehalogenase
MPFVPAPPLPDWLHDLFPVARAAFRLEHGVDTGRLLHFVDQPSTPGAPTTAATVVLLHGNPTWSFLWRKVIAGLPELRVLAPDLLGCGLSDGLALADHGVARHLDALAEWLAALAPGPLVLVGQDWGGPMATGLGARIATGEIPGAGPVVGVVLGNTAVVLPRHPRGTAFHRFGRLPVVAPFLFTTLGLPQRLMTWLQGDRTSIRGDVARAYRWPLRDPARRETPLALTRMVPDGPSHPSIPELRRGEAWITAYDGPVQLVWGMRDPLLTAALGRHQRVLSRAVLTRTDAGHFLQEETPEALVAAIQAVARS